MYTLPDERFRLSFERRNIRDAYYNMSDLQKQREWLLRHISEKSAEQSYYSYYLPNSANSFGKWRVCRSLFTETLGISFSQVRTVLQKVNTLGILEGEKRGGRQQIETDNLLKEQVTKHIDTFPRMESHYCRANSNCQYLSPDLNFEIMYKWGIFDILQECC